MRYAGTNRRIWNQHTPMYGVRDSDASICDIVWNYDTGRFIEHADSICRVREDDYRDSWGLCHDWL